MHILLAEDDVRLQQLLKQLLEELGHTVLVCADAPEAIRALHEVNLPYEAMITDMQLPVGTGVDILFELWAEERDLPSLLHSAETYYAGEDLRQIYQQFPFARFRSKSDNIRSYIVDFLQHARCTQV